MFWGWMRETSCGQLMSHRTIRSESLGFVNRPERDYCRRGDSPRLMSDMLLPARKQFSGKKARGFWNTDILSTNLRHTHRQCSSWSCTNAYTLFIQAHLVVKSTNLWFIWLYFGERPSMLLFLWFSVCFYPLMAGAKSKDLQKCK